MLNFGHFMSLRARQSRAWQSLCCENLRLLRPEGLAMTQKRRFATVNSYIFSLWLCGFVANFLIFPLFCLLLYDTIRQCELGRCHCEVCEAGRGNLGCRLRRSGYVGSRRRIWQVNSFLYWTFSVLLQTGKFWNRKRIRVGAPLPTAKGVLLACCDWALPGLK